MRRLFKRAHETGLNSLREAIHMSRATEDLDSLPERFASVISQFESLNIDPTFRNDVYQILNGAVDVALSMVDLTFPVEQANSAISRQLSILGRALHYLQSRPSSQGFSILLPEKGQLIGHYTTREEAEEHLLRMQRLGVSRDCVVVPTKVLSLHAIQPKPQTQTQAHAPSFTSDFPDQLMSLPEGKPPNEDTSLNLAPEQDLRLKPDPALDDLTKRLQAVEAGAAQLPREEPKQ
jgi:hypothetical protein